MNDTAGEDGFLFSFIIIARRIARVKLSRAGGGIFLAHLALLPAVPTAPVASY
jgi:hypothetical protein